MLQNGGGTALSSFPACILFPVFVVLQNECRERCPWPAQFFYLCNARHASRAEGQVP
jgi:hypothetical protein